MLKMIRTYKKPLEENTEDNYVSTALILDDLESTAIIMKAILMDKEASQLIIADETDEEIHYQDGTAPKIYSEEFPS